MAVFRWMSKKLEKHKVGYNLTPFLLHLQYDLQGNQIKASAVSTVTKSLPIALPVLVNYSLLVTLDYIIFFLKKRKSEPKSAFSL